jgi:hypothetical protein
MIRRLRQLALWTFACLSSLLLARGIAQAWPDQPIKFIVIKIIVSFPPAAAPTS